MTAEISAIVERARQAAQASGAGEPHAAERDRLKRIAAEFESMLLVQVLKDMRRAGSWEEEGSGDTLGAESLFETLDVELASHLARVQGMGLSRQLEEAFVRLTGAAAPGQAEPALPASVPAGPVAAAPGGPHAAGGNPVVAALRTVVDVTAAAPKAVAHVVRPVAGAVTSAFGWRQDPFTDKAKFHQGVDLRAAYGQEVHAAAAGRVVFSGEQGGYGTTVLVEHADGTRTRYAHLSARLVEKGEELSAGQTLGRAGRSGRATGTHLHFEVIAPNGRRIAPEQWAGPVLAGRQAAAAAGNSPLVTVERPIQDRTGNAD